MDRIVYKYSMVEKRIKDAIKQQHIVDQLPGERVLAKEFGVSYMTVRKAVENLVANGWLYKIPGKGTYVKKKGLVEHLLNRLQRVWELKRANDCDGKFD